jgi:hypothetical protein
MKRTMMIASGLLGFMLAAGAAMAGYKLSSQVSVTQNADGSGSARGALGSARNSVDSLQYIGCEHYVYTSPFFVDTMHCFARTSAGVVATCYSTEPTFIAAAASMSGDSYVSFTFDSNAVCTSFVVGHKSQYEPKK